MNNGNVSSPLYDTAIDTVRRHPDVARVTYAVNSEILSLNDDDEMVQNAGNICYAAHSSIFSWPPFKKEVGVDDLVEEIAERFKKKFGEEIRVTQGKYGKNLKHNVPGNAEITRDGQTTKYDLVDTVLIFG